MLLIHGIIGETLGMASGLGPAGADLTAETDVVLALDYENLDTAIEVTGRDLASALSRIGIGADGGPRLTVLAHSMGGLVARCFLERQGGAAFTDRLVTCGTPHQGSPWPRVEDACTALLGLALNLPMFGSGIGAVVGSALAGLGRAAERFDTALDEMRPGSDLLTSLTDGPDPGTPYVLVRGTEPFHPVTADSQARRIVRKLTGAAVDGIFGGEENDVAVSILSSGGVGANWPRPPQVIDAACNHLSYFSDEAGLKAVRTALES
jgi:pimeloyl-ACP methyl ester carboxylesterase